MLPVCRQTLERSITEDFPYTLLHYDSSAHHKKRFVPSQRQLYAPLVCFTGKPTLIEQSLYPQINYRRSTTANMQFQLHLISVFSFFILLFSAVQKSNADSYDRSYCYCKTPDNKPHKIAFIQTFHYHSNRIDKDYEWNITCGPEVTVYDPEVYKSSLIDRCVYPSYLVLETEEAAAYPSSLGINVAAQKRSGERSAAIHLMTACLCGLIDLAIALTDMPNLSPGRAPI